MNGPTKKKKVLHLVEDLRIGGLERVIASIVLGLDGARYEVHVWCLTRGGEIAEELIEKGVSVRVLGMHTYHNPLHVFALSRLIRKEDIHILHTGFVALVALVFCRYHRFLVCTHLCFSWDQLSISAREHRRFCIATSPLAYFRRTVYLLNNPSTCNEYDGRFQKFAAKLRRA